MGKQRPEDHLHAVGERILRRLLGTLGGAGVVLYQQLDVGVTELGERHFGGVFHRLRRQPGVAASRQRQDQCDFRPAGADGLGGLWGSRRRVRAVAAEAKEVAARKARACRDQHG